MSPPSATDAPAASALRGQAFGIQIASSFAIPCLPPGVSANGAVPTVVDDVPAKAFESRWSVGGAQRLIEYRLPNGRRLMTVDHHPELGYRIWALRFGRHLVSNDGRSVTSSLPDAPSWRWQRLLFAQALPLAAALRGLDPFHASAVAVDGRAFAFVAASGTGKTSLAAHLVASGASFMTDDILSLQLHEDRLLAHPGPAMTSVAPSELAAMKRDGRERLGTRIGREAGKAHLAPPVVDRPYPLAGIYYLVRDPEARRLAIEERPNPDVGLLLASSFLVYVRTPDHLVTHLETCARIAETVRVFEVRVPNDVSARTVSENVASRLGEAA